MNKKEFATRVSAMLRESNMRKPVRVPKQVFHISTDAGEHKDFVIRQSDKNVPYTTEDVSVILEACLQTIRDAIKRGESLSIRGFGVLGLKYRKPRVTRNPITNEMIPVEGRYVPKFTFGDDLRNCARIFGASVEDGSIFNTLPSLEDEEDGG